MGAVFVRALACAAAFFLLPLRPAHADESAVKAQSRALYAEGVQALDDLRPGDALVFFQRAYETYRHYETFFNIGLCNRALARPLEAAEAFERFLTEGGSAIAPDKRAEAARLVAEMDARNVRVTIQVTPLAKVLVDGRPLKGEVARVAPGEHTFEASAEHRKTRRQTITARAGEHPILTLALMAEDADENPPRPLPLAVAPTESPEARFNQWFWISAGLSAAALTTGTILGVVALSDSRAVENARTPDDEASRRQSQGKVFRVLADTSFLLGIAGATVAVVIATRKLEPTTQRSVALVPVVGPRTGGVGLTLRF